MEQVYAWIRDRARLLIDDFPAPRFYADFAEENRLSRSLFESDPLIADLRSRITGKLNDHLGHGFTHVVKVARDVGALTIIEGKRAGYTDAFIRRRVTLVHCAALLHDIDRNEDHHAEKGARTARKLLVAFPFEPAELEDICRAIHNHEAFKKTASVDTREGALTSNCLYDADKFRWGPDNFSDTVWRMVSFSQIPITEFIRRFPEGMAALDRIKNTFRTHTGKLYGPQFIELGLTIGKELFKIIQTECTPTTDEKGALK